MTNETVSTDPHEMSIWDHLNELRKRLFIILIALLAGTGISFSVTQFFIEWLSRPIGGMNKLQASIDRAVESAVCHLCGCPLVPF